MVTAPMIQQELRSFHRIVWQPSRAIPQWLGRCHAAAWRERNFGHTGIGLHNGQNTRSTIVRHPRDVHHRRCRPAWSMGGLHLQQQERNVALRFRYRLPGENIGTPCARGQSVKLDLRLAAECRQKLQRSKPSRSA